ncbi:hypothetical protein HIM_01098 [Hirsutella minnesotensis 3608]|nr:hypothetical protein HIM_01098 [Hirsutella minnesotensis 3608]
MSALQPMWVALRYAIYFLAAWALATLIHRLTTHPLAKYPGPFLAKISGAHGGFHAIGKRPHINIYRNFQKYGPIYRAGPDRLLFNSLDAVKDIYNNPRVTKAMAYRHSRWLDRPNVFDTQDRNEHRRKRKVIASVVADRSLKNLQPRILTEIDVFLRQLYKSRGEAVNVTKACKRLAIDIIGYLSFGYELKTQTDEGNRWIPRVMGDAIYTTNIWYTWPALGFIELILRWLARYKAETFRAAIQKLVVSRMSEPVDAKPDFYASAMSELEASEGKLEDSELWGEALFFVTAGGTTVSSALSGMFFNLSQHPEVYERLAAEIRTTFSRGDEIQLGPKLASCKYLRAVIDESIRLSPPSLSPLWRVAEDSTEPFVVDGHVIPRGTEVSIHLYSIVHNAEYFTEPFTFRPDRWLDEGGPETEEQRATMRLAQVSFGVGDRSCAGKSMAYMETSIAMAKTLWYFDFRRAPGEAGKLGAGRGQGDSEPWAAPDQFQLQDILVADHDGPNIVFEPRQEYRDEMERSPPVDGVRV